MVTDLEKSGEAVSHDYWPQRRWGLALLGALAGIAIHLIMKTGDGSQWSESTGRAALASFIAVSGIGFAYVVERAKIRGSATFACISGFVVASVLYWSGDFTSWEPWRLISALLTVVIAAPLFQGWRDGGEQRWHIPYVAAHDRAWTNVCLWFTSWAFVGIVFLLSWLLASLFDLIGIDALRELLQKNWFAMTLAGAALGGAIGLLRDREKIVSMLQRIVMMVLAVLAPVLAVGLVLFLAALPFTGLGALWETTKATTPILLSCVIGALILANAVIGDRPEDESRLAVMRWSAMALGATMLPLGIIAAISTGQRIQQYGLTPERLWAVTFTAIACAFGLAYLVSLVRGRGDRWSEFVRPANLRLAIGLCGLALLLSTPLISFGAISARDQVARLESGNTPVDKFDFAALRFDFGPAGVKALKRLATEGKTAEIRKLAGEMAKAKQRYEAFEQKKEREIRQSAVVLPKGTQLPEQLIEKLRYSGVCAREGAACNILYDAEKGEAVVFGRYNVTIMRREQSGWQEMVERTLSPTDEGYAALSGAFAKGLAEIRTVDRRQLFVDGQPVGQSFE